MGFWQRLSLIFKSKANNALEKHESENMDETLDYSYQRQLDMLAKVKRGMTDIATSRKQVENQMSEIGTKISDLDEQAASAIKIDRDDLAREILTRKSHLTQQKNDLAIQHAQLQAEEERISRTCQALQVKVEQFRIRKETVKAQYKAASATSQIQEAYAGIDGEFSDIGFAITRAEDKTAEMQARAEAIGELLINGSLDSGTDWIDRELNEASATNTVEHELEALKMKALPAGG